MSNVEPNRKASPAAADEEIRALRAELARRNHHIAALEQATGGLTVLEPEERPVYEMLEPWFSPDCVYYPTGAQVEDITGTIVPNEHMVPLNAAAEARMMEYLSALPDSGTLPRDLLIEAAMQIRPREGDDPRLVAEYHGRVVERAMELKYMREGRIKPGPGEKPPVRMPVRLPTKPGHVPVMANVRIREVHQEDRFGGYRDRFMPGTLPQRPANVTRQRAPAQSAAEKSAPVMGTVASQPLGNVGPGVTAP